MTKAALYYHVRNKEELLFECCKVPIAIGLESLRRAQAEAAAPDQQLGRALTAYIEGITDEGRGGVVLAEEGALSPGRARELEAGRDEYRRGLRGIVARGVAEGVFVPCDPGLVGLALLGAVEGIPRWYDPARHRAGREVAESVAAFLVRGLRARG